MTVESSADRATYLADFGVTVTWTRSGTPSIFTGIFDRPSLLIDGMAENTLIDRDASLICREADLPAGAAEDDQVSVAGVSQAYLCRSIRPDGQGFATVDLKKAS